MPNHPETNLVSGTIEGKPMSFSAQELLSFPFIGEFNDMELCEGICDYGADADRDDDGSITTNNNQHTVAPQQLQRTTRSCHERISSNTDAQAQVIDLTQSCEEDPQPSIGWNEHDVPLGRSQQVREFIGNIRFRELVEQYRPTYMRAVRKADKTKLTMTIYDIIKSNGGRFLLNKKVLRHNSANGNDAEATAEQYWYEIEPEKAWAKIGQALRNGTRPVRKDRLKKMFDPPASMIPTTPSRKPSPPHHGPRCSLSNAATTTTSAFKPISPETNAEADDPDTLTGKYVSVPRTTSQDDLVSPFSSTSCGAPGPAMSSTLFDDCYYESDTSYDSDRAVREFFKY